MRSESQILPPKTSGPRSPVFLTGVVLAGMAVGVGVVVFFFNPGTHAFYPVCVFHALTGWNCPGCGMTRALYALLHGQVLLALKDNALFVALLAALGVWGVWFAARKMRQQSATFKVSPKFLWVLLILALLFAVSRNLPGFEWLSP